jgi:hypothetical protein
MLLLLLLVLLLLPEVLLVVVMMVLCRWCQDPHVPHSAVKKVECEHVKRNGPSRKAVHSKGKVRCSCSLTLFLAEQGRAGHNTAAIVV